MDATSFQFMMTMPGDERLMDTVRDLTLHAAKYAQLPEPDVEALVAQVLAAARVSSSAAAHGPVELHFERTPARLDVAIEWEGRAADPAAVPRDSSTSVRWSHHDGRQRCLVSLVPRV